MPINLEGPYLAAHLPSPRSDGSTPVPVLNPQQKKAQETPSPTANPGGNPNLDRVPNDFESSWLAYLAQSKQPEYYGEEHKNLAKLGYVWAIRSMKDFLLNAVPF